MTSTNLDDAALTYEEGDPVIVSHVKAFRSRADAWRVIANVSFVAALASALTGTCLFIFADRVVANSSRVEELRKELESVRADVWKIEDENATVEFDHRIYPYATKMWGNVSSALQVYEALGSGAELDGLKAKFGQWNASVASWKEDVKVLRMIEELGDTNDPAEPPTESVDIRVATVIKDSAKPTDTAPLIDDFAKIIDLIERSHVDGEVVLSDEIKSEIRLLADGIKANEHTAQAVAIRNRLNASAAAAEKAFVNSLTPLQRISLRRLNEQENTLAQELSQERANFNPNNLYSVVPLVVVRLGAVIMLIFLTQILLAAYRYNTMLSSYYSAIADALSLARGNDSESFQKSFSQYCELLVPKHASFVVPESPASQIAALRGP